MVSLDRGFVAASENAGIVGGPIGGSLNVDGTWDNARPGQVDGLLLLLGFSYN